MSKQLGRIEELVCQADNACTKEEWKKVQPLLQQIYDLIQDMK